MLCNGSCELAWACLCVVLNIAPPTGYYFRVHVMCDSHVDLMQIVVPSTCQNHETFPPSLPSVQRDAPALVSPHFPHTPVRDDEKLCSVRAVVGSSAPESSFFPPAALIH